MFTGIVEEIGVMRRIYQKGEAMILSIGAKKIMDDVQLGDSIAVNGACLTVVSFDQGSFSVDVMPETFRRTSLRLLQTGSEVNLERAMKVGGRFGGHIVQGHVDGVGTIVSRTANANAVVFEIGSEDPALFKYMIPKGSVTIDGISLTLIKADQGAGTFAVSIIPHTLAETVLQHKKVGDIVNVECDVLGKYVDHLLHFRSDRDSEPSMKPSRLTEQFLAENGFI